VETGMRMPEWIQQMTRASVKGEHMQASTDRDDGHQNGIKGDTVHCVLFSYN
jgi:hypothetical protein